MIRTLPSMEPQTQSLGAPGLLVRFNTTLTLLSAHFDECLNALDRPGGGAKNPQGQAWRSPRRERLFAQRI
ncbi:MAG: hypothetical protein HY343_09140 [Lentisphaerae bacterium]|nr:hypothetical protein [Lentisphaerota bacterium]